jgi:tetratricopeptide (TPR) repeat protein
MSREFFLLGHLDIKIDGEPSELLKSPKGCALVAYLMLTGKAHTREAIADLLWEVSSTAQGLRNLRSLLNRLHPLLPELEVTRSALAFQPGPETWVDLYILRETLTSPSDDFSRLDEALRLYRGNLLEGFVLDSTAYFEEWLVVEREQLRIRVLTAYARLCQAYEETEQWEKGLSAARRWQALDLLDESAHQYVLRFLSATGALGAGLKEHETFRQRLWTELGVEPEPATAALVAYLKEQWDEQGEPGSWAEISALRIALPAPDELPEPGPLPPQSILPHARNDDFTGREFSLRLLAQHLLPWESRSPSSPATLAVTGMGGLGKTQLAVEFCYRYGRFFPGGVYWLNFSEAENVAGEVVTVGSERALGLYRESDNLRQADKIGRVLKAWQEPIPRLLIFDNCEEVDLLQKWLPVTGGCSVLLTSHRADWARELQVIERRLPVLDVDESVRFLQNLVPELAEEDAASIAQELGYLPLALHLAGSFLRRYRQITANQYLIQLRDKTLLEHPSLHGRGTDFSPTGHELDIARTFAINWEQLAAVDETDAIALKLLANAAQFAPSESIPRNLLLSTVVNDENDVMQMLLAEDGLARLIALGFIRPNEATQVSLHRLVIAFVQSMSPDVAGVQTAVAKTIWGHIQAQWGHGAVLDQLAVPPAHVKFIMDVELAKGTRLAVHLAHAWGRHLMDTGDYARSRIYLEQALALCEKLYGINQSETADILIDLGTLTWYSDTDQAAWPHYQRAYSIYEQCFGAVHFKVANSLTTLAILHSRTGDYEEAIAKYQRALDIYEQVLPPDDQVVGLTQHNLAEAYQRMGRYKLALSHAEESLRIRRKMWSDDHPRNLTAISSIGMAYFLMGEYQLAYEYFLQAFRGRQERLGEDHPRTTSSLSNVGVALGFLGKYEESISHLKRALELREKIYGLEHTRLVYTLTYMGVMYQEVGEMENARPILERGLSIQESGHLENEQTAETLTYLAAVVMQMGEAETAEGYLQRALTYWEQRKFKSSQAATTLIFWGEYLEASGDNSSARSNYKRALSILSGHVVETHRDWQNVQAHLARMRENG